MNKPRRGFQSDWHCRHGLAWVALTWSITALAAEPGVAITKVGVAKSDGADEVRIETSGTPVYSSFNLEAPSRVVVDIPGSSVSAVEGTSPGAGSVKEISASEFKDGKVAVGRIVIATEEGTTAEVRASGNAVIVRVRRQEKAEAVAPTPPAVEAAAQPTLSSDDNVVSHRADTSPKQGSATRITSIAHSAKGSSEAIKLVCDGTVGNFEVTELRNPARLAIDISGVKKAPRATKLPSGTVASVRTAKQTDGVRVVLDLNQVPPYIVERTRSGLQISFTSGKPTQVQPTEAAEAAAPVLEAPSGKPGRVSDVKFKGDEREAQLALELSGNPKYEVTHPDDQTAVMTIHHAELPQELERSMDTSAFGGPVKMVSAFRLTGGDVRVVASLDRSAQDQAVLTGRTLQWKFTSDESEVAIDGAKIDLDQFSRAEGLEAEAPGYAASSGPRRPKYVGRRVSFEFKDIDIHNLFRIIAEVSKKNLIVGDDVSGRVTIRLRNVPWDQALDVILKVKGLDKEEIGNIVRIAHASQLAEERAAAAKAAQDRLEIEEPKLRLIPVNYASAAEIADKVKEVLTKRGTVTVDHRTNVLIVKDVLASLTRVEGLVRNLDLQTPQILIEARIVEADTTFAHEVGVQWGGQIEFAPAFGNQTGLLFPSTAIVTGGSSTNQQLPGLNATPNFAVDLPAAVGTGNGGGLGFIFGSAGGAAALNLRISALENQGSAKTISAPKVTTVDNHAATISQGIAIPFSQFSAGGVNTTFIEAKLELKVLPHVTSDGSVVLTIDATNNQPNPGFTGANGQPSITKKEAHTQVLIKDGDTTVIGGIYTRATGENENMVPILGRIPILGYFFRHRAETDSRTELLIFITPHIVNRQQVVASATPPAQVNP